MSVSSTASVSVERALISASVSHSVSRVTDDSSFPSLSVPSARSSRSASHACTLLPKSAVRSSVASVSAEFSSANVSHSASRVIALSSLDAPSVPSAKSAKSASYPCTVTPMSVSSTASVSVLAALISANVSHSVSRVIAASSFVAVSVPSARSARSASYACTDTPMSIVRKNDARLTLVPSPVRLSVVPLRLRSCASAASTVAGSRYRSPSGPSSSILSDSSSSSPLSVRLSTYGLPVVPTPDTASGAVACNFVSSPVSPAITDVIGSPFISRDPVAGFAPVTSTYCPLSYVAATTS